MNGACKKWNHVRRTLFGFPGSLLTTHICDTCNDVGHSLLQQLHPVTFWSTQHLASCNRDSAQQVRREIGGARAQLAGRNYVSNLQDCRGSKPAGIFVGSVRMAPACRCQRMRVQVPRQYRHLRVCG